MGVKLNRQNRIKEILNKNVISSQEELLQILKNEGTDVTQATLSRDFAEMGVVRTFTDHGVRYVFDTNESGKQISKLIGYEIISVSHNEQNIVVRTLAGRAMGVAYYIDRLNKEEILGTIGGDDTVLIIPNKQNNISTIVQFIKNIITQNPEK